MPDFNKGYSLLLQVFFEKPIEGTKQTFDHFFINS